MQPPLSNDQHRQLKAACAAIGIGLDSVEHAQNRHLKLAVRSGSVRATLFEPCKPNGPGWYDDTAKAARRALHQKGAHFDAPIDEKPPAKPPAPAPMPEPVKLEAPVLVAREPAPTPHKKPVLLSVDEKAEFYSLYREGAFKFSELCALYDIHPQTAGVLIDAFEKGGIPPCRTVSLARRAALGLVTQKQVAAGVPMPSASAVLRPMPPTQSPAPPATQAPPSPSAVPGVSVPRPAPFDPRLFALGARFAELETTLKDLRRDAAELGLVLGGEITMGWAAP